MAKRTKKAKRSLENVHTEYDEHGNWNQEQNRIKGALRQAFRMSPQMWESLQEARVELPPKLKKDGSPGKAKQVRYRCAICEGLFQRKFVQVDHIEPVVPLHKVEANMTKDEIARGIFCKRENLQVVCSTPLKKNNGNSSCHKIKTDEENFIRKKLQICGTLSIDKLKEEFKQHLIDKEIEVEAKAQRKIEREAKREAKRIEREQKRKK